MSVTALLSRLAELPGLARAAAALLAGEEVPPLPSLEAAKPPLLAALHHRLRRPLLVITGRGSEARALHEEIAFWRGEEHVYLLPDLDALPYERLAPDPTTIARRLAALGRLAARSSTAPCIVVTGVRTLIDRLPPPALLAEASRRLAPGTRTSPDRLLEVWLALGYTLTPVVERPGEISRRGGILDICPLGAAQDELPPAYRLDFFGDEIESIRRFDLVTQRSLAPVEELVVGPAHEVLPRLSDEGRAALSLLDLSALAPASRDAFEREREQLLRGESFPQIGLYRGYLPTASLLDYLPAEGVLVLDEPGELAGLARELEEQAAEVLREGVQRRELPPGLAPPHYTWQEIAERLRALAPRSLALRIDTGGEGPFTHPPSFAGRLRAFLDLAGARGPRETILVVSQQDRRLAELLAERDLGGAPLPPELPARGLLALEHGALRAGWRVPELGLTCLTDNELFGWTRRRRNPPPRRSAAREAFLADLEEGDYVVHVDHGIARYRGLVRLGGDQGEREYMLLEYADGDRLYVPTDQTDRVTRYIGAGDAAPSLTRLSSGEWTRAKRRVRAAVRDIARELVELYAARELAPGHAFAPDSIWQRELEESFPYIETPDQAEAVREVKEDMERPRPMDRLLVGDVGYGKTEIALRAAFKAVLDGKQVAVLVPTTVLAQQHYATFRERLAAFPVRVEMLSRFRSEREQKEVLDGLRQGTVDICIGTHRLVQKDVVFKDLGLVIIDEEQRFGVVHKERLKQLRREVDVLTLTATPIPRTLHMALVGVRDLSTIETPPEERLPIRTFVMEYDEGLVREAILRELDRGGQVYFVHNRVYDIDSIAFRLRKLVPEARIAVAHGQMPEEQLERVMVEFAQGEHDVLVCTTIIESGLDIPNVNTIIVHRAQHFGLAQLYQLRGRVGRGASRAYAYFLYTRDGTLSEVAERRLRTIAEATELGAGFRIAMKDLEIRGAGNLLGAEQHGHIAAVGFDLYCRLLAEQVELMREAMRPARVEAGPKAPRPPTPALATVDLPIDAYLPPDYVPDEASRLNLYQRLAAVRSGPELGALLAELEDRFGPLPEPAQNLAYALSLRLTATAAGIQEIAVADGQIVVRFPGRPPLDAPELHRRTGLRVTAGSNQVRLPLGRGQEWLARLQTLVEALAALRSVSADTGGPTTATAAPPSPQPLAPGAAERRRARPELRG